MYHDELIAPPELASLLSTLCESLEAGVCVFDEAGRYILVNRAYCAIHGYRPEDLLGQPFTVTVPPGVGELSMQLHRDVLDGASFPPAEWLVRRPDGANIPVRAVNRLLRQSDGSRLRVVVVEDRSALRRLEEERDDLLLRLQAAATTDGLTQTLSRTALLQAGEQELLRAQRYGHPLSVVLFDLDHFRQVNDTFGPTVGDEVLRLAATLCRRLIRISDTLGRYGGEEFALILPVTDDAGGLRLARRLRRALSASPLPTAAGPVQISASFGVGASAADDASFDLALMRASAALYVAKQRGRNRVVSAAALGRRRGAAAAR